MRTIVLKDCCIAFIGTRYLSLGYNYIYIYIYIYKERRILIIVLMRYCQLPFAADSIYANLTYMYLCVHKESQLET